MQGRSRDVYVHFNTMRHLKTEGEAEITQLDVRKELLEELHLDIGDDSRGSRIYRALYERLPDPADRDELRASIATTWAPLETPSTRDDGASCYEDTAEGYARAWDAEHPPQK